MSYRFYLKNLIIYRCINQMRIWKKYIILYNLKIEQEFIVLLDVKKKRKWFYVFKSYCSNFFNSRFLHAPRKTTRKSKREVIRENWNPLTLQTLLRSELFLVREKLCIQLLLFLVSNFRLFILKIILHFGCYRKNRYHSYSLWVNVFQTSKKGDHDS